MSVVVVLALLHAWIGVRLLSPFSFPVIAAGTLALAALFALLMASASARSRRGARAGALEWAGLVALGFFSSLVVLTLLRDALAIAVAAAGLAGFALSRRDEWSAASAAAVPLLACAASATGFFNARRRPALRDVEVPVAGLPAPLHGFTIVQISDLHVGPTIGRAFVERVVEAANEAGADLIALTGDLVDGRVDELRDAVAPLAGLRARDGVFAVTGNHEYYSGAEEWIAELRRLGVAVLLNEHAVVERDGARLVVGGVTDYSAHHFAGAHRSDPARALAAAPAGAAARVLLAHQPRSAGAAAAAGFDLQISGHTHGGQFVPWNFFVSLQQPYTAGLHRLGRMWIYISRGTGYWGPPMRLGAPSEIGRLRLVAAAS